MPKVSELQSTPALASGDLVYVVADGVSSKLASLRVANIAAMVAITAPANGMSVEVVEAGRAGLFVFDTSATAAGNNGTTFSATDATTGSWVRRFDGATVHVDWFAPTTAGDSTSLVAAAIAATPVGGILVGPSIDILTQGIDFNKKMTAIFPKAITRHADATALDSLVTVSGDDARATFHLVDFNAPGSTVYAGRGETIRVTGDNVVLADCTTDGNPFGGSAQGYEIRGANCSFIRCLSKNAGYGGFRVFGTSPGVDSLGDPTGTTYIGDCESRNFRVKGIVTNGNNGVVEIVRWRGSYNATEAAAASEYILGETGTGTRLKKLIIRDCHLQMNSLANGIKFVSVREAVIEKCSLVQTNTAANVRVQLQYAASGSYESTEVSFRDCYFHRSTGTAINSDGTGDRILLFDNCVFDATETSTFGHINHANYAKITNCTMRRATALVDPTDVAGTTTIIDGLHNASSGTPTLCRFCESAGDVRATNLSGAFTRSSTTARSARVQVNSGTPRYFLSSKTGLPAGPGWLVGDMVYFTNAALGERRGVVCVTAGTIGTDAEFVDMPTLGGTVTL